eukprot:3085730-Prymnesium_polylepis.4
MRCFSRWRGPSARSVDARAPVDRRPNRCRPSLLRVVPRRLLSVSREAFSCRLSACVRPHDSQMFSEFYQYKCIRKRQGFSETCSTVCVFSVPALLQQDSESSLPPNASSTLDRGE